GRNRLAVAVNGDHQVGGRAVRAAVVGGVVERVGQGLAVVQVVDRGVGVVERIGVAAVAADVQRAVGSDHVEAAVAVRRGGAGAAGCRNVQRRGAGEVGVGVVGQHVAGGGVRHRVFDHRVGIGGRNRLAVAVNGDHQVGGRAVRAAVVGGVVERVGQGLTVVQVVDRGVGVVERIGVAAVAADVQRAVRSDHVEAAVKVGGCGAGAAGGRNVQRRRAAEVGVGVVAEHVAGGGVRHRVFGHRAGIGDRNRLAVAVNGDHQVGGRAVRAAVVGGVVERVGQ